MKNNTLILFPSVLWALVLSGCATDLADDTLLSSGRFSITTHQKQLVERNNGSYQLLVTPDGSHILKVKGPLGTTVATLEQSHDLATLTYSDGKKVTASNSSILIHRLLGISFSMEQLLRLLDGSQVTKPPLDKSLKVTVTKDTQGQVQKIKVNGNLSVHEGDFFLLLLPEPLSTTNH